ncbi:MAG: argininosuccinate lyase [Gemmatimonadaceae bacterium]|nr:argininosuccinate lyase [Gemmatimonadaceae bacterium]
MTEERQSHKLWGGRFSVPSAVALDALNRSIGTDFRLWPYDLRLSKAWAVALSQAGIINIDERQLIETGLDKVAARLAAGTTPEQADEDVHTMIDRMLHEEAGDIASKLHTGRSRNDQVSTATRLWTIEACGELDLSIRVLQQVMIDQALAVEHVLMPSYTHMQRAQPVSAAHWMLSHFWPLERDRARLAVVARNTAMLPLGSGAIAGSAYPVSRALLQENLGFTSLSQNSIDAVGDRDFVAEILFCVALLGVHLSRLAEDLIMYGSSEFGFVRFGEAFTTGSSMMPQKRNPDALELARASGARTLGDLTALLATLKGLPSGYNKDLQDDKRALFGAVDLMLLVLPAVAGSLGEISFDKDRMQSALSSTMMATDLADYLVGKGVSFREAHEAVGSLIREGERNDCELNDLGGDAFSTAHPLFGDDVIDWLDPAQSVSRRGLPGGTAPAAVRSQIEAALLAIQSALGVSRG